MKSAPLILLVLMGPCLAGSVDDILPTARLGDVSVYVRGFETGERILRGSSELRAVNPDKQPAVLTLGFKIAGCGTVPAHAKPFRDALAAARVVLTTREGEEIPPAENIGDSPAFVQTPFLARDHGVIRRRGIVDATTVLYFAAPVGFEPDQARLSIDGQLLSLETALPANTYIDAITDANSSYPGYSLCVVVDPPDMATAVKKGTYQPANSRSEATQHIALRLKDVRMVPARGQRAGHPVKGEDKDILFDVEFKLDKRCDRKNCYFDVNLADIALIHRSGRQFLPIQLTGRPFGWSLDSLTFSIKKGVSKKTQTLPFSIPKNTKPDDYVLRIGDVMYGRGR